MIPQLVGAEIISTASAIPQASSRKHSKQEPTTFLKLWVLVLAIVTVKEKQMSRRYQFHEKARFVFCILFTPYNFYRSL